MILLSGILLSLVFNVSCSNMTCTQQSRSCPPPWLAFRNHCYLYKPDRKTFTEAEGICSDLSKLAHLVSISDSAENQFAFRYAQSVDLQDFWIGYNDVLSEGNFFWTDGNRNGFTEWDVEEPNDFRGNQDCTYLNDQTLRWDDKACSHRYAFMCKIPKNE